MGKEQNTDEKISIMDAFTVSPLAEMLKLNLSDCMALFKVYRTTYYNNKNSAQKEGGRKYELNKEDMKIKLCFIEIVKKIGYVPGSRTFHTFMIRDYGIHVSVDRCRRLMKEMKQEKKIKAIPHKGRVGTEPLGGLYVVLPIKWRRKTYA